MRFCVLFLQIALHLVHGQDGNEEDGHCIMYDTCGWDQDYGEDGGNYVHFLNCAYDGPPKPASREMLDILQDACPHLYENGQVGSLTFVKFYLKILLLCSHKICAAV